VKKKGVPTREYHVDKFVYDVRTDVFVCPAGNKLTFHYLDHAHQKNIRVYRTDACFSCEFFMVKCTLSLRVLGKLSVRLVSLCCLII